jgi:CHASE2 domain-containing sensor protein
MARASEINEVPTEFSLRGGTLRSQVVILASAISAGVHAALAPEHFEEGAGAGLGFVAATVLLAGLALWLTLRPNDRRGLAGAALLSVGLIASYALAITNGLPVLHPGPEPVDGLALATKAIEAVGLLAATSLLRRPIAVTNTQPKGTLT